MPVLGEVKRKKIILPSSVENDEAWVEINTKFTTETTLMLAGIKKKDEQEQARILFEVLSKIIIDWNFTLSDKTTKAPINPQNISQMDIVDIMEIQKGFDIDEAKLEDAKKKALSLSSQPQTPIT